VLKKQNANLLQPIQGLASRTAKLDRDMHTLSRMKRFR
jgi:hypothetical protein